MKWPLPWRRRQPVVDLAELQRATIERVLVERDMLRHREALRRAAVKS